MSETSATPAVITPAVAETIAARSIARFGADSAHRVNRGALAQTTSPIGRVNLRLIESAHARLTRV